MMELLSSRSRAARINWIRSNVEVNPSPPLSILEGKRSVRVYAPANLLNCTNLHLSASRLIPKAGFTEDTIFSMKLRLGICKDYTYSILYQSESSPTRVVCVDSGYPSSRPCKPIQGGGRLKNGHLKLVQVRTCKLPAPNRIRGTSC